MKHNNGKAYEVFVASLQEAILNSEYKNIHTNIIVEHNKKIIDNCGIERQFDVYWEYELGGLTYKTVIECKDYNSKITVDKIDSIIGKIKDIPDLKPVFATKKGYQSGAEKKARKNNVELLIIREQNESDWIGKDGTPYIKKVSVNYKIISSANILKFLPIFDVDWIHNNTDIGNSNEIVIDGLSNEIFIIDKNKGTKKSLHKLSNEFKPLGKKKYGEFEIINDIENGYIKFKNNEYKILKYKVVYQINPPRENKMEIDFSKEYRGVIEYLNKGIKKSILKNGKILNN